MGLRETNRLEYLKQPHILVIGILILVAVIAAVTTAVMRINDMRRISTLDVNSACREFIEDENLCKFAAQNEKKGSNNYALTTTSTDDQTTEITIMEYESLDRMKSTTFDGPREIEAFVIIDAATYVKDYSDNTWAKYVDSQYKPSIDVVAYDFTNENSQDVIEFRDNYKPEGTEPCNNLTCFKYKVTDPSLPDTEMYIWFDDQDYLLRRHLTISPELTTNTEFSYKNIHISEPAPVKEVSEEELSEYL